MDFLPFIKERSAGLASPTPAGGWTNRIAEVLRPQYTVRDHPPISQVDILVELDGDHLLIRLHDDPLEPVSHTVAIGVVVVAINFHNITHAVFFPLKG
jgi:hypothetical protein